MFANQKLAFKMAEQFAAQQRAREIAQKGYSNIQINNNKKAKQTMKLVQKTRRSSTLAAKPACNLSASVKTSVTGSRSIASSKSSVKGLDETTSTTGSESVISAEESSSEWVKKKQDKLDQGISKIRDASNNQDEIQEETSKNIHSLAGLAKARMYDTTKVLPACLSMNKVKKLQQLYKASLRKQVGLKELEQSFTDGFVKFSELDKSIDAIVSVQPVINDVEYPQEQLLSELAAGAFIPTLDGKLVKDPRRLRSRNSIKK